MENKRSIGITILGKINGLIYLLIAIFCFMVGTYMTFAGNLGFILGIPFIMVGIFIIRGFNTSVLLLKLNPKGRKSIIELSFIMVFIFGVTVAIFLIHIPLVLFIMIIILIMSIINVYFFTRPQVKEQFTEGKIEKLTSEEKMFFSLSSIIFVLLTLFFIFYYSNPAHRKYHYKNQKYNLMQKGGTYGTYL